MTRITFIGAGSTIFMKNIVGDALLTPALADSHFALMDIDAQRLAESEMVVSKMIAATGAGATVSPIQIAARPWMVRILSSPHFRSVDISPVL